MKLKLIILLFFLTVSGSYADIQEALDSTKADFEHDLSLITGWFCSQLAEVITFGASSEINLPAETLEPGAFEVGMAGAVSVTKLDTNAFKRLQTRVFNTTEGEMFGEQFPFGSFLIHAKYGISEDYDLGIKSGGISVEDPEGNITVKNTMLGAEARMQMMKKPSDSFNLVGAIAINMVNGLIEIRSTGTITGTTELEGTTYNQEGTSSMGFKTNWNFTSLSLRTIASTELSVLQPFLGLQVDMNFGKAEGEFSSSGNMTLTEVGNPGNTQQGSFNFTGPESSTIPLVNLRILAGFELNFSTLRIGLSFESAGDNSSTTLGIRLQF